MHPMLLLAAVVIAALAFDFANGWNDSANAIATVVSTRVLSPFTAVAFAAVLNVVGALVSDRVAKTIGGGLVSKDLVTPVVILASMLAAAAWVTVCTHYGLPISGSHSLVGGLVGATVATAGWSAVNGGGVKKVLVALVVSPVLGFLVGYAILVSVYWVAYAMTPQRVRIVFSSLQVVSSGFMAFTHGMNDAQKVMGVITLALVTAGHWPSMEAGVPVWVMLLCAAVMGLGTALGGWKVIRTLGMNLAHIRPIEGFAAETAAGIVLSVAAAQGVPVSTTHTITGSILGVGTAYRARSVQWSIGAKIIFAWIFTLPAAGLMGGALSLLLRPLAG
jgi:PiT family inorganic phosphate transporter